MSRDNYRLVDTDKEQQEEKKDPLFKLWLGIILLTLIVLVSLTSSLYALWLLSYIMKNPI